MVEAAESQVMPIRGAKWWPLSVEAYHVLGEAGVIPENTELLHGLVYSKMPKSPLHTLLLYRLLTLLQALRLPGLWVRSEQPLTFQDSEPEPDISIVNGGIEDYAARHPNTAEIVIEICVSSYEYDRSKLKAYALANVRECWLVLGSEKRVEIHSQPQNGAFQKTEVRGPNEKVQSSAFSNISVDLDILFAPQK